MDNNTPEVVFPPNVNNQPGSNDKDQNESGDAGTGSVENKESNESEENKPKQNVNNSPTVEAHQSINLKVVFNQHQSTEPNPDDDPDSTQYKKYYEKTPPGEKTRGEKESKKREQTTSDIWIELTGEFVTPRGIRPEFDQTELLDQFKDLENNKLIFITCADEQMAKAAACALLEKLTLPDQGQKRLLDFGRIGQENSNLEITQFLQGGPRKSDLAVVVDLFNPKAEKFFDSLIDSVVHSPDPLWQDLQHAKVYLICVVYGADLRSKLTLLNAPTAFAHDRLFPHWQISFLELLLKYHFPEEYRKIAAQISERRHWWDSDERVFCHQLKTLIHERRLIATLEAPPRVDDAPAPQTLFKNQDAIIDTVLYVGTFFTELKPREFNRVVNLLLTNKTKTITVSTVRKNENGTSEPVEVEREKPLAELWQESMDKIKAECGLTAAPAPDGATVVGFRNHKLREELREYLRSDYPFFLNNQLEELMKEGLIFDSSETIATNVINLAAEVTVADPEYLQEWVEELLDGVGDFFALDLELSRAVGPNLQPLASLKLRDAKARICQRLAGLIKRMLEAHGLKEAVNDVLEQFMRRRSFLYVLEIVKALRFAPEFDEFYWFKQLIERGDEDCYKPTLRYLSLRLQNSGSRVYQILQGMDAWVKVNPESYSRSGVNALELLIEYCINTTVYFSFDHYGAWPSLHPLFRFADKHSARQSLRLLSRWLFHPRMGPVIDERISDATVNSAIATLIGEWFFILLRPGESSTSLTGFEPVPLTVTAQEVAEILIEQIAMASDQQQQDELVSSWEYWSAILLNQIEKLSHVDAEGNVKIWKRNLLNELVAQFKVAVYERQAAQMAT